MSSYNLLIVSILAVTCGGCSGNNKIGDIAVPPSPRRIMILYGHGPVGLSVEWALNVQSNGGLRESGSALNDSDLRQTFALSHQSPAVIKVRLVIDDEPETSALNVSSGIARIVRAAETTLSPEDRLILYVYSKNLTRLLDENGISDDPR